MKKEELKKRLEEVGDAVITYRSQNSRKLKYNVCTADFSTEYIRQKRNRAKESNGTLLLFCWDTDSYRLLVPENVTSIVPLNRVIRND
jgi:ubiquinone/menaquinone biosynthesis C-methylase UbiE